MSDNNLLTTASFSGGEREGRGMFDELMRTVKSHLKEEYSAKRITGSDYTKVYLEAMNATMANANQFLLNYMLTNQQSRLLDEQINSEKENTKLVQAQLARAEAELRLLEKQILLADKELAQADANLANTVKQGLVLDEEVLTAQKAREVQDAQISKLSADTDLTVQQKANAVVENSLLTNQVTKVAAETAVLNQKQITEEYQTKDTVNGEPVAGIVGAQKQLYHNQADGYIRDAEQKAAKIFMDSFNTRTSVDTLAENEALDATVMGAQIKDVLNKVRQGVNVSAK